MNIFKKFGHYADYTDIIEFSMRESSFTIDSLIEESYKAGVLILDDSFLIEVLSY